MTGFLGRYEYQLDQKGRVSLPAEYRHKAGAKRFVLVQWEPTHLTLFPEAVWDGVKERLLEMRRSRADLAKTLREVTSRAKDVTPDKQGRILIPSWLKEGAGLDGTVLLVGAMDRIEIWDQKTFLERHPHEVSEDAERIAEMHRIFG